MRDGAVLRCNVFRPEAAGRFPVIITLGPYGKDAQQTAQAPQQSEVERTIAEIVARPGD